MSEKTSRAGVTTRQNVSICIKPFVRVKPGMTPITGSVSGSGAVATGSCTGGGGVGTGGADGVGGDGGAGGGAAGGAASGSTCVPQLPQNRVVGLSGAPHCSQNLGGVMVSFSLYEFLAVSLPKQVKLRMSSWQTLLCVGSFAIKEAEAQPR